MRKRRAPKLVLRHTPQVYILFLEVDYDWREAERLVKAQLHVDQKSSLISSARSRSRPCRVEHFQIGKGVSVGRHGKHVVRKSGVEGCGASILHDSPQDVIMTCPGRH